MGWLGKTWAGAVDQPVSDEIRQVYVQQDKLYVFPEPLDVLNRTTLARHISLPLNPPQWGNFAGAALQLGNSGKEFEILGG